METEVFDPTRREFTIAFVNLSIPEHYYLSLKRAFELVEWIIQVEKEEEIDYKGDVGSQNCFFCVDKLSVVH
jgi:hypothetical protein